jgi:uncharacterized membrane protein YdbT with pleckstrin-like domain
MRCPQCGTEAQQGAAFCSRCGTRLYAPKPADVREYMLARVRPSLWYYANSFLVGGALIAAGAYMLWVNHDLWQAGFGLTSVGALIFIAAIATSRAVSWSVTSDRIIERRGILSSRRREMELADIRSVEVNKRFAQRLLGLGDVSIASAASADFTIHLHDISGPDAFAETVRKARLKRLA